MTFCTNMEIDRLSAAASATSPLKKLSESLSEDLINSALISVAMARRGIQSENLRQLHHFDKIKEVYPVCFENINSCFDLLDILFRDNIVKAGTDLLIYIRDRFFKGDLRKMILTIWEKSNDLVSASVISSALDLWYHGPHGAFPILHYIINSDIGEDCAVEIFDLVWDHMLKMYGGAVNVDDLYALLKTSIQQHYVSIVDDIFDKYPELLTEIYRLKSSFEDPSEVPLKYRNTILHLFCPNVSCQNHYQMARENYNSFENEKEFELVRNRQIYSDSNKRILETLLANGSDINELNESGMSPLHYAISLQNAHIVGLLLDHGADPSQPCDRHSMLTWILMHKFKDVVHEFRSRNIRFKITRSRTRLRSSSMVNSTRSRSSTLVTLSSLDPSNHDN